jgi:hypothetical protein
LMFSCPALRSGKAPRKLLRCTRLDDKQLSERGLCNEVKNAR